MTFFILVAVWWKPVLGVVLTCHIFYTTCRWYSKWSAEQELYNKPDSEGNIPVKFEESA